jgi:membrane associated rhomboid family serine protease
MCKSKKILCNFLYGLSYTLVILLTVAIIVYIITYYFGKAEPPGFELATISAIIGGLILASAGLASYAEAQDRMKRTALFYLIATIAFVVFGLFFPIADKFQNVPIYYDFILKITAISIGIGAVSFSIGTVWLAFLIPKLW